MQKKIYLIIAVVFISCATYLGKSDKLIDYVDPFIGSGGHGHVFVGANVPFGGVQVGPTNFNKGWDWSSSYHHTDSIVKGFCHINVSGTGMSDLGELTIMPATGKLMTGAGRKIIIWQDIPHFTIKTKNMLVWDTTRCI